MRSLRRCAPRKSLWVHLLFCEWLRSLFEERPIETLGERKTYWAIVGEVLFPIDMWLRWRYIGGLRVREMSSMVDRLINYWFVSTFHEDRYVPDVGRLLGLMLWLLVFLVVLSTHVVAILIYSTMIRGRGHRPVCPIVCINHTWICWALLP